jgi:hypothetical protein
LLASAIAGQALYVLPWLWVLIMITLVRAVRRFLSGQLQDHDRLLMWQAVPPLLVFLGVGLFRPLLPHWSLVGLLPVIPMVGRDWLLLWPERRTRLQIRVAVITMLPLASAILVAVHAQTSLFQQIGHGGLLPVADDPTAALYGWDKVVREIERRELSERPGTIVFTSRWYYSGQLGYALHNRTPVLCYNVSHAQNFAYWSRPEQWVGKDALFVGIDNCAHEAEFYAQFFARFEPIGECVVRRAGVPIRTAHIYRCVNQVRPFPFGNNLRDHSLPSGPKSLAGRYAALPTVDPSGSAD